MRTTIKLPGPLAEAAKQQAAAEGRTFTSLVEEALRSLLDKSGQGERNDHAPLPSHGDPGSRPLVDLSDREALWDALEETDET